MLDGVVVIFVYVFFCNSGNNNIYILYIQNPMTECGHIIYTHIVSYYCAFLILKIYKKHSTFIRFCYVRVFQFIEINLMNVLELELIQV